MASILGISTHFTGLARPFSAPGLWHACGWDPPRAQGWSWSVPTMAGQKSGCGIRLGAAPAPREDSSMMTLEKKRLSLEEIETQTALELPNRELLSLITVVITNVLNNLSVDVTV